MSDMPQNPRQPKWTGPAKLSTDAVPIARPDPGLRPASFPFAPADTTNMFPPVCIRSHWDPTQIIQRILPNASVALPLTPRPYTKVCMEYKTTQEFEQAPRPADGVVFPMGGDQYPPTRFRESIDFESQLRGLDRPLGTCERDEFVPPRSGTLYRANSTVPDRPQPNSRFIDELAFPKVCMRDGVYDCVADAQKAAWNLSPLPFNNATKQNRYGVQRMDLVKRNVPMPIPTGMQSLS
jgi:hypothetical protein